MYFGDGEKIWKFLDYGTDYFSRRDIIGIFYSVYMFYFVDEKIVLRK